MDKEEYKKFYTEVYRHSLAHILAKAVIEIFGKENVQYAIGPQIADGFYYDFLLPRNLVNEDFKEIENKMREIMKRREDWKVEELSRDEALALFEGQKFKTELITDLPEDEKITVYYTGDDFVDLCRGPHVSNSQELMSAAFQIKSVSGAYWRGDEHRDQLQRIYVYAYENKQDLSERLKFIKEAQESKRPWSATTRSWDLSSICSCSTSLLRVCLTGCPADGNYTTRCSSTGEAFRKSTDIWRFQLR